MCYVCKDGTDIMYCMECGKPTCANHRVIIESKVFCPEHAPSSNPIAASGGITLSSAQPNAQPTYGSVNNTQYKQIQNEGNSPAKKVAYCCVFIVVWLILYQMGWILY